MQHRGVYICYLIDFPNPVRQGLSPLLCVRKLKLKKVIAHPSLQSKDVGELVFKRTSL